MHDKTQNARMVVDATQIKSGVSKVDVLNPHSAIIVHLLNVTLVESKVEMSRKLGLLLGLPCQHAFMILATTGGQCLGTGRRKPFMTCSKERRDQQLVPSTVSGISQLAHASLEVVTFARSSVRLKASYSSAYACGNINT